MNVEVGITGFGLVESFESNRLRGFGLYFSATRSSAGGTITGVLVCRCNDTSSPPISPEHNVSGDTGVATLSFAGESSSSIAATLLNNSCCIFSVCSSAKSFCNLAIDWYISYLSSNILLLSTFPKRWSFASSSSLITSSLSGSVASASSAIFAPRRPNTDLLMMVGSADGFRSLRSFVANGLR